MAGPIMDAAFLTYEGISSDPVESNLNLEHPVWLLGKYFKPDEELEKINGEILSKIWLTYRKNYPPIGGTGPMSDTGWGCMLRCGQMMLAQALVYKHLGRRWDWRRDKKNPKYMRILRSFLDRKDAIYSIHQIAQMGVSEGKQIGQWFGPNTVAQVIRKLVLFDEWGDLAVHVAMDNTVVIEDIKKLCKTPTDTWGCYGTCSNSHTQTKNATTTQLKKRKPSECTCHKYTSRHPRHSSSSSTDESDTTQPSWRPLLLFIPLRLGLTETNPDYYSSLKVMFTLKQSLGVIGGKPNHAHYFIGFNHERLLYLDPHTTQPALDSERYSSIPDASYHCVYPCFMHFSELDPSIALGFYCHTEDELDDWKNAVKELVIEREKRPMFEITEKRPKHWPPFVFPKRPCDDLDNVTADFTELTYDYGDEKKEYDSSGEYEII